MPKFRLLFSHSGSGL